MTVNIQFDFPFDEYRRLITHPDGSWGTRQQFYAHIFSEYLKSPEFRLRELEQEKRRLQWERDQARRERDEKAKSAEFWKERAGGVQGLFAPKPNPAPQAEVTETAKTVSPMENQPGSVH